MREGIHSFSFFLSGKKDTFIVSGSEDSTLKIWKVALDESGKHPVYTLHSHHTEVAHDKGINSVALSPDNKWIASAGGDKTAKVTFHAKLKFFGKNLCFFKPGCTLLF
jgi:WD40 repeat protein